MTDWPGLRGRLLLGAVAGAVGAVIVIRVLKPARRRDSGPPAEHPETDDSDAEADGPDPGGLALGAACGSLLAAADPRIGPAGGAVAGAGIWVAGRLGWLPEAGLLASEALPPRRRNALLIAGHMLWGAAAAILLRGFGSVSRDMVGRDRDQA